MNQSFTRGEWTSASNAQADSLCPGRHLAQKGLPQSESADAAHGTEIHRALATGDPSKLDFAQRETYDACQKIEGRIVAKVFGANADKLMMARELRLFCRVPVLDAQGNPVAGQFYQHSGQPDVIYRYGPHALVIEYKTLPGDLPATARNEQLRDQIVLRARVPESPLEDAVGVVIQPLVTHDPEHVIYLRPDIDEAERRMFDRVRASNNPNSPRVAGEVQCKFCLARGHCDEYQRYAGALVPQVSTLLEVPVALWKPEERAAFADRCGVAEKFLADTWAALKAGAEKDPGFVPGYEIKPGNVKEAVTDAQACFERFMAIEPKPASEQELQARTKAFMAVVSVSKGKLKECVSEATALKGMALKTALETMLAGIVSSKQNAPSLVKSK